MKRKPKKVYIQIELPRRGQEYAVWMHRFDRIKGTVPDRRTKRNRTRSDQRRRSIEDAAQ